MIDINEIKPKTYETVKVSKAYYENLRLKASLVITPKSPKDDKRIKMVSRIYTFIKDHPGCGRKDLISGLSRQSETKVPEGTIKRYLADIPYLKREGKARASQYYVEMGNSPKREEVINDWMYFIKTGFKIRKSLDEKLEFEKDINKILPYIQLLAKNGNMSILIEKQKQYGSKPKHEKRSNSSKRGMKYFNDIDLLKKFKIK